jgi:hypothetical protein
MQAAADSYYNYRERYDPSVDAPDPFGCEVQQPSDLQIVQRKKNSHWNQQCRSYSAGSCDKN